MFYRLFIITTILLFGCKDNAKKDDIIVVGMSMDFPPFEYIKNGEPVGFEVDLIREIGKILGKDIKLVDIDFGGIIPSINSAKVDMGVSGFSANEERRKTVDFTQCYYYASRAIVWNNKKPLHSYDDFAGKTIGVQTGTVMEKYLKNLQQKYGKLIVKSLAKNTILIQELKLGRIDGVFLENAQAVEFSKSNPNALNYTLLDKDLDGCYSMALPKNSALLDPIEKAIEALKDSGKIAELEKKWLSF